MGFWFWLKALALVVVVHNQGFFYAIGEHGIMEKNIKVKVRSCFSHGCYGKEVFREFSITASSKKEAIEQVKQEMFRTTYYDFFPQFKMYDDHNLDWYGYGITTVFPQKKIGFWLSREEMKEKVQTVIQDDIFQRIEIVA